ncbi:hypothetical protein [Paraburkholderia youngii]|uniref:hypothetical protein n=1 Tax=Paraburkholderia youngii TaxID=2782701 RepID=UPI0015928D55|nr:hypothetical protein [Paraburkholderia youngii]
MPGVVFVVVGGLLAIGGIRLAMLGGSWYYLLAGIAIAATGVLMWLRRRAALFVFAIVLFASTIWAAVEARFDFWQLLPRLWVWVVLAIWLLLPPVSKRLALGPPAAPREGMAHRDRRQSRSGRPDRNHLRRHADRPMPTATASKMCW